MGKTVETTSTGSVAVESWIYPSAIRVTPKQVLDGQGKPDLEYEMVIAFCEEMRDPDTKAVQSSRQLGGLVLTNSDLDAETITTALKRIIRVAQDRRKADPAALKNVFL